MSVAAASAAPAQNPLTIPCLNPLCSLPFTRNHLKSHLLSSYLPYARLVSQAQRLVSLQRTSRSRIGVVSSGEGIDGSQRREVPGELDNLLSAAEVLFIAPPAIYSIGCVVGLLIPGAPKQLQVNLGSKVFVWQFFLLVSAVAIGGLIRRRQWQRICRDSDDGVSFDLIARIEKVEDDLRSSATIVRVLSRQLEKLGIRFRVTRKTLKEPIAKMAALSQKNSEATRALAMQEDTLEKELGEIQKVLLAMQEQQQKQLELILAIGKAGKLFESKRDAAATAKDEDTVMNSNPIPEKKEGKVLEIQTGRQGRATNDRS